MIYRISDIDVPGSLTRVLPRRVAEVLLALGILFVVIVVRGIIDAFAPGAVPFALLFPAVLFATVLGGWRTGAFVAGLGGTLTWYFILPSKNSFAIETPSEGVSLALYSFSIGLVILVTDAFRQSARAVNVERAAQAESEARFHLVAENAPVNLWMGDADGKCVYLNRAQREFWGVPEDLGGFSWGDSLLAEDAPGLYEVFGRCMAAREPFEVEARYRRADGEIRTLATRAQPRFDGDGHFVGMIGVNVDVTDARKHEMHQRLLLNELNHRVKNTLTTVQSLASQSLRAHGPEDAIDIFSQRLLALSAAHDVLTNRNWEDAPVRQLVAQAVRAFDGDPPRFVLEGPPLRVPPKAALALAMALHELGTNAVKYGALSVDHGQVSITWTDEGEVMELVWRESGGPPVKPPTRQGFGGRLMQGLVGDLGAAPLLDYAPGGVVCTFRAPVL